MSNIVFHVPSRVRYCFLVLTGIFILSCSRVEEAETRKTAQEPTTNPHSSAAATIAPTGTIPSLQTISQGVASIAKQASQAVVLISTARTIQVSPFEMFDPFEFFFGPRFGPPGREPPQRRQEGLGSGFIINLDEGYVITNNHVVEGAEEITLKLVNEESFDGKVVGRDPRTDIAVIKINSSKFRRDNFSALKFADSSAINAGEFVIALGAPFGLETSVSFGVISATQRGNLNITELGDFIQTDAAINPGNSGGPLLNVNGEVIGVNTAIFSRSGAYAGIGFAVPSNLAQRVATELIKSGRVDRGYLGVQLQSLGPNLKESLGLDADTQGALVAHVAQDGPAAAAGVEPGDIITSVNNHPIRDAVDLSNSIGLMSPGTEVELDILRGKKSHKIRLRLGKFPEQQTAQTEAPTSEEGDVFQGMSLAPVSEDLAQQFNFESREGVVILNIRQGSVAERAGLLPGDVILLINGQTINSPEDVYRLAKNQTHFLLRVERQGSYFFTSLKADPADG